MRKYFKDEETKKIKLSEYLKMPKSEFKYYVCEEKYKEPRIKYIIDILGDVELDKDTYISFMREFDCCGGRYDVRTKKETIKGIYSFLQKYPFLSADTIELIWFRYIHDLFEIFNLKDKLGVFFEQYGKTEKALKEYFDYVDKIADEFDKQFYEEADKLSTICEGYDSSLIEHLQGVIKRQHISVEDILSSLPSKELIYKDKTQLMEIMTQTRIYCGACHPISYQMIESLATGKGVDSYLEQPKYLINGTTTIDTTFTKQEFLDSIQKEKVKKLEKNR